MWKMKVIFFFFFLGGGGGGIAMMVDEQVIFKCVKIYAAAANTPLGKANFNFNVDSLQVEECFVMIVATYKSAKTYRKQWIYYVYKCKRKVLSFMKSVCSFSFVNSIRWLNSLFVSVNMTIGYTLNVAFIVKLQEI